MLVFLITLGVSFAVLPADAGLSYLTFYAGTVITAVFFGMGPGLLFIALTLVVSVFAPDWAPLVGLRALSEPLPASVTFALSALALVWVVSHFQRRLARQQALLRDEIVHRQELAERLRQSLQETEKQQSVVFALIENSPDGVFIGDATGRFHDVNRRGCELLGYTKAQILARTIDDVVPEEELARWPDVRARLLAGHAHLSEWRFIRKDGSEFTGEVNARMLPDGRLFGLVRDITARRRAENALREHEQKLSLFIEAAPAGIAMFDRDMRYLAASRRFLDDCRIDDIDVIGRSHFEIFPDVPPRWRNILQRCLAGETLSCTEDEFPRSDGRVDWVRWEIRPWFTASGEVGGIILFTEGITARKRADDELRSAKAEAERANNAKSRFLAAASHDLRQPLAALALYAGTFERKATPGEEQALANMRACIATLSDMLSEMLDLSKLDAGVVTPNVSDFDLDAMLATLVSTHSPEAKLKGLVLRCAGFGVTGRTDAVLFHRIVGNLIANAIRYTERGGVLIGRRRRQGKTWVEVWDTGIGIPADKTDEIFEEFKQLGNQERNRVKGSGLGLAIVAKSAALLGLELRVRSRLGRGSVFGVELPLGEAVAEVLKCPPYAHRPRRIALVEDNTDVASALAYCLTDFGHQVVIASSGASILPRLDGAPPDIVISDYRLAGPENGFGVIAAVRANFRANLPAIIITGDTDPSLLQSTAAQRIVLQHKPLNLDALRAAIAELTN